MSTRQCLIYQCILQYHNCNGHMETTKNMQLQKHSQHSDEECSDLDTFEILSTTILTIGKSQQILQCMREVIVTDPTFTPMSLFKYLNHSNSQLTRKNLLNFLDQNSLLSDSSYTDHILSRIFSKYGINSGSGVSYSDYLRFIYPFNTGVLRDLLANKIKKYAEVDRINRNYRPSDSVITGFLLLLEQEIKSYMRIQTQIQDSRFPGAAKLRKVVKSIKKASEKVMVGGSMGNKGQNTLSMLELRNFVKAFVDVQDSCFLDLGRRLGMNKDGQINTQNLQILLKKSKKSLGKEGKDQESNDKQNRNNFRESLQKRETRASKDKNFKDQLYRQLANTLNTNGYQKPKTPRSKSTARQSQPQNYPSRNRTPTKNLNNPQNTSQNSLQGLALSGYINDNKLESIPKRAQPGLKSKIGKQPIIPFKNNNFSKKQPINEIKDVLKLFREFIETFLKGNKQIQRCKVKMAGISYENIDYLSLFKSFDEGRGVIQAESLKNVYIKLSGIPTDFDFQYIIDRYAQPEQKWLSYSEFTQIFKCSVTTRVEVQNDQSLSGYHEINGIRLHPEVVRMMSQILYLTLDLEDQIRRIFKKFKKSDIEWLFSKINIDSESKGFINYQQLKKFLTEELELNLPMTDLMSLLKRLDRSRNGVVVKAQFLTF